MNGRLIDENIENGIELSLIMIYDKSEQSRINEMEMMMKKATIWVAEIVELSSTLYLFLL